ncbi:hypothetical protein QBC47DRAFT_12074 [Echria macrotheca]|uniref:Uncharacterized protein n=1 Tax=Echria macrotheca TaxID=438768 RepID=A0AAJ0BRH6_9PEZI|nr:hypothetical protein QBC47DRAFT_12074 [Echria macrotheca]
MLPGGVLAGPVARYKTFPPRTATQWRLCSSASTVCCHRRSGLRACEASCCRRLRQGPHRLCSRWRGSSSHGRYPTLLHANTSLDLGETGETECSLRDAVRLMRGEGTGGGMASRASLITISHTIVPRPQPAHIDMYAGRDNLHATTAWPLPPRALVSCRCLAEGILSTSRRKSRIQPRACGRFSLQPIRPPLRQVWDTMPNAARHLWPLQDVSLDGVLGAVGSKNLPHQRPRCQLRRKRPVLSAGVHSAGTSTSHTSPPHVCDTTNPFAFHLQLVMQRTVSQFHPAIGAVACRRTFVTWRGSEKSA